MGGKYWHSVQKMYPFMNISTNEDALKVMQNSQVELLKVKWYLWISLLSSKYTREEVH